MAQNEQVAIFHDAAYEQLLDEMNSKDDLGIRLGDTLDVKASILLAAITLLATQTAYFMDKHELGLPHYLLIASGLGLAVATIAAFFELWPRNYQLPVPEKSGIERVAELLDFYSKNEGAAASAMVSEFLKDRMGWVQYRISKNEVVNESKSKWLEYSFYFTAAAMTLNLITLFMRLF